MFYHLLNIETSECFNCDDQIWISAIDTAIDNGWDPDGTLFDFFYDASDKSSDVDDALNYFYMLVVSKNEALEWDGNYIEKKNQHLMYEDTIYLAAALEGSDIDPELISFIKKGSFRICSM